MGDIDNSLIDDENWTQESVGAEVRKAVARCGNHYYIPCITQGGPGSVYPGVYEAITEELNLINAGK